jgi:hypothetical protein
MLRFHNVHGCNIQLEEGGYKAVRHSSDSFCDGVTFRYAANPQALQFWGRFNYFL